MMRSQSLGAVRALGDWTPKQPSDCRQWLALNHQQAPRRRLSVRLLTSLLGAWLLKLCQMSCVVAIAVSQWRSHQKNSEEVVLLRRICRSEVKELSV